MVVLVYVQEHQRVAGSQRSLLHALKHIQTRGITFLVAFPAGGKCPDAFRDAGFEVAIIEAPGPMLMFDGAFDAKGIWVRIWILLRHALPYWIRVAVVLRRNGVDAIHCNSHRSVLFCGPSAWVVRRPVIWHVRGRLHPNRALRRVAELLSNRIILVSSALSSELSAKARSKATVVPNAIDDTCFDLAHREAGSRSAGSFQEKPFTIGILATVVPYKGIHHAVAAMNALRQWKLPRKPLLLIAGDTPDLRYRQHLTELIESLSLTDVQFLGYLPNPYPFLEQIDTVLMSSVERDEIRYGDETVTVRGTEGLPRVVLEAMYMGKAVVASDVAGVRDQVQDEVTGLLVPPGDSTAIAKSIFRLMSDDDLRSRLELGGFRHVRQSFSTEAMVEKLLAVYGEFQPVGQRR